MHLTQKHAFWRMARQTLSNGLTPSGAKEWTRKFFLKLIIFCLSFNLVAQRKKDFHSSKRVYTGLIATYTTTIPWAMRHSWLQNTCVHPPFWRTVLTPNIGQTDLVFGVWSGCISRSVHGRLQVSVKKSKEGYSSLQGSPLRELTYHMESHSVTCHPAEVTFPP